MYTNYDVIRTPPMTSHRFRKRFLPNSGKCQPLMKFDAAAITWYVLSNWHIIRVLALRRECISIEPWLNSFVWFSLTAVNKRATFHFTHSSIDSQQRELKR